jgi:hypothetical protein
MIPGLLFAVLTTVVLLLLDAGSWLMLFGPPMVAAVEFHQTLKPL